MPYTMPKIDRLGGLNERGRDLFRRQTRFWPQCCGGCLRQEQGTPRHMASSPEMCARKAQFDLAVIRVGSVSPWGAMWEIFRKRLRQLGSHGDILRLGSPEEARPVQVSVWLKVEWMRPSGPPAA